MINLRCIECNENELDSEYYLLCSECKKTKEVVIHEDLKKGISIKSKKGVSKSLNK